MTGIEVFRCYDEFGPVKVYDDGAFRYLTFGEGGEQSRIQINAPCQPVYQYTQAMLLVLLFMPKPQHATLLGLGAGSIANALLNYSDTLRLDAVELRPQVVAVAREWFQLSRSERLAIHISDAQDYLNENQCESDLIFADMYNDDGMMETQLEESFLHNCYHALSQDGVLVLNLWDEGKGFHPRAQENISQLFDEHWIRCPIDSGNLIVFAFKGSAPVINPRRMQAAVNKLSDKLEVPLNRLLAKINQH